MRLVGFILIGYGLGSDNTLCAALGIGLILFSNDKRALRRGVTTVTDHQFNPARPPDQPALGGTDTAIAPWAGAYNS